MPYMPLDDVNALSSCVSLIFRFLDLVDYLTIFVVVKMFHISFLPQLSYIHVFLYPCFQFNQ
jgi:hypothetical protein